MGDLLDDLIKQAKAKKKVEKPEASLEEPKQEEPKEVSKREEQTVQPSEIKEEPKKEEEEKKQEEKPKTEEKVLDVASAPPEPDLSRALLEQTTEKPSKPIKEAIEPIEVVREESEEREEVESEVFKDTILIAAEKSDGKTTAAYSFEGTKFVFAYDNQAYTAARNLPFVLPDFKDKVVKIVEVLERDEQGKPYIWFKVLDKEGNVYMRIHLINQLFRPRDKTDKELGKAATAVINKTFEILDRLESEVAENPSTRPDWIIVDNFELFIRWSDWAGRLERGIGIFQKGAAPGQDLWGVYDERLALIRTFWSRVMNIAKKGVIYTTYVREVQTITGETRKVPKWVEAVKYETMHHILIDKEIKIGGGSKYIAKILGTKDVIRFPDGLEVDITNKGLEKAIKEATSQG